MKRDEEYPAIFPHRFLRYRLLHFIACRVLGDEVRAPIAIAFRYAPHFEDDGSFRSWLVRVLIGEALPFSARTKKRGMQPRPS